MQGTITKSSVGGPYLQLQIQVDPVHNPLLNPSEPLGILSPSQTTDLDEEAAPQTDEDFDTPHTDDDDDSFDDELNSLESSTFPELNEHGRSILHEEESTSGLTSSALASSSSQLAGQQTLDIKQFFGGKFGRYGASKLAIAYPAGSRVRVHCKVSPGSSPGEVPLSWEPQMFCCKSARRTLINDMCYSENIKKSKKSDN